MIEKDLRENEINKWQILWRGGAIAIGLNGKESFNSLTYFIKSFYIK